MLAWSRMTAFPICGSSGFAVHSFGILRDCLGTVLQLASDRLSAQEFDVCLVDYQLPDGTGTLLIREINKNPLAPPCIMLTSQEGYQTDLESCRPGRWII